MARDFVIPGECMVRVKFGDHLATSGSIDGSAPAINGTSIYDLGLSVDDIVVAHRPYYKDINTNEFGPNVAAEVTTQLLEAQIKMKLINYDQNVLDACFAQAWGGRSVFGGLGLGLAGTVIPGAGQTLGHNLPLFASGNFFVSLNILANQNKSWPYRFPTSYVIEPMLPQGTHASVAQLTWRAIPYNPAPTLSGSAINPPVPSASNDFTIKTGGEVLASGAKLFDHTLDD